LAALGVSARISTLAAVSLATLMTYLDNNVINVAIPTIERDLHLSVAGLEWVVSSYLLVLAGLLLVGGRLADAFGRRRIFLAGMTIFTLSSLVAGVSGSGGLLIGARAVQGLGAALLMPATLAIISATFTNPQGTDDGDRDLGCGWSAWPGAWPGDRRNNQRAHQVGLDFPHQRADRRDHVPGRGRVRRGVPG
jgi:MFS family permease